MNWMGGVKKLPGKSGVGTVMHYGAHSFMNYPLVEPSSIASVWVEFVLCADKELVVIGALSSITSVSSTVAIIERNIFPDISHLSKWLGARHGAPRRLPCKIFGFEDVWLGV